VEEHDIGARLFVKKVDTKEIAALDAIVLGLVLQLGRVLVRAKKSQGSFYFNATTSGYF